MTNRWREAMVTLASDLSGVPLLAEEVRNRIRILDSDSKETPVSSPETSSDYRVILLRYAGYRERIFAKSFLTQNVPGDRFDSEWAGLLQHGRYDATEDAILYPGGKKEKIRWGILRSQEILRSLDLSDLGC